MISSIIHQLLFASSPLAALLIPPNSSPIGKAGGEKGFVDEAIAGKREESRFCAGETAGAGTGGHEGGGRALYIADECLRPTIKPPFMVVISMNKPLIP